MWYALIAQAILAITSSLVARAVTALGFGVVAYTGMTLSLNWLKDRAVASVASLPADILGMMATMKVGESMSIVLSAMIARAVINGLSSDTVKRWVTK